MIQPHALSQFHLRPAGLRVTNQYDLLMRRTNLAVVNSQGAVLASTACAYDEASRLSQVSSGTV
ncbi:MAG TPA: hypothetical protein PKX23_18885, partial [Verrucomicrobiota bacterium]|nr:hypothetical protein [Verrucomicrobiota bacterium]